jgi:hypothetical protein
MFNCDTEYLRSFSVLLLKPLIIIVSLNEIFSAAPARGFTPNIAGSRGFANRPVTTGLLALLLSCVSLSANACCRVVLHGEVNKEMAQQVIQVIARGEETVDLASEWRRADGRLVSGGVSQVGWFIGDMLRLSHVKVRCIGLCFSSAAHILIASRGCVVGLHGRVGLHVPGPIMAIGAGGSDFARIHDGIVDEWRQRLASYEVPADIVARALYARNGWHELSTYEMKRLGCEVE